MGEAKSKFSPPGESYARRLDELLQPGFYAERQSGAAGLGMRLTSWEPGEVLLEWRPQDEHVIGGTSNLRGRVHGGFLAILADYAMGLAAWSVLQDGEAFASSDLHVQYFRPAAGTLAASACVVRRGRRAVFCSAVIREGENEVARAAATEIVAATE